jgi:hypothetical protein
MIAGGVGSRRTDPGIGRWACEDVSVEPSS